MQYFVLSDIHGSFNFLEKAIQIFEKSSCEKILILGDILYHGPRNDLPKGYEPKKVIELLNTYKNDIIAIRGNCDAEVDQMVLEFPILADYSILNIGNIMIYMTHGHLQDLKTIELNYKNIAILSGHTHIPTAFKKENKFYLNPGSLSIPKSNFKNSYAILSEERFDVFELETNLKILSINF